MCTLLIFRCRAKPIQLLVFMLAAASFGAQVVAQATTPNWQAYPVQAVITTPTVAKLRIYPEGTTIKKTFRDTNEVRLIAPEYVLASMASANSYAWDLFHAEDERLRRKAPAHYNKIADHPLGFSLFELHYVLEIEAADGQPYAFARVGLLGVGDKKPSAGYFFKKINGSWKLETARRSIEENYALVVIKPRVLYELIAGDPRAMDSDLLAIRKQVTDENGFNLTQLGRLIWSWFQDDTQHAEKIAKYCDNPNWNN